MSWLGDVSNKAKKTKGKDLAKTVGKAYATGGVGAINEKKTDPLLKTAVDPLGLGVGDALFGKNKGPDYSAYDDEQAAAQAAQQAAYDDFIKGGAAVYQNGSPLTQSQYQSGNPLSLSQFQQGADVNYETLSPADQAKLRQSAMGDIKTDPRLVNAEMDALRGLEERSKEGLTLQDQADMARLQGDVNRRNRGRMGAIQQNMQARGMAGSGMDLLAQMQSNQDATEMEAIASLEKAAQAQNNKRDATNDLGNMASQQRGRAFAEDSAKAQARDAIERFNTTNMVNLQNRNVDTRNQATNQNWDRRNSTNDRNTNVTNDQNTQNWNRNNSTNDRNVGVANDTSRSNWERTNSTNDRNVGAGYDYRKDKMTAGVNKAGGAMNWSADQQNRQMMQDAQNKQGVSDKIGGLFGAGGAVVGGIYGGPAGAQAGYQGGKAAGGAIGNQYYDNQYKGYAHGGLIDGPEYVPGDHPANDQVPILASGGEMMLPKSVSTDPAKAAQFVADETGQNNEADDVIGALLQAMNYLNKRK